MLTGMRTSNGEGFAEIELSHLVEYAWLNSTKTYTTITRDETLSLFHLRGRFNDKTTTHE